MTAPQMIEISLVHEATEERVGDSFRLPVIPAPGLVIVHATRCWQVLRVQLSVAQRGSASERDASPARVDVIVTETQGIFRVVAEGSPS